MKIIFACHTIYQIFVAYVIRIAEYSETNEYILLVEGRNHCEKVVKESEQSDLWNEVLYFDSFRRESKEIEEWLYTRRLTDVDILHIGAWGGRVANLLSNHLKSSAYIVIDEEGTASYSWLKCYQEWIDRYYTQKGLAFNSPVNLNKIKKAMFFDARISDNQLNIEERSIDLKKFLIYTKDKKHLDMLNKIFGYQESENTDYKYVFFDQNLLGQRVIGNDFKNFIVGQIADNIYPDKLILKQHPSEKDTKQYSDIKNLVIDANHLVPWELIFINRAYSGDFSNHLVYITYCSSAAFNSYIFGNELGIKGKIILLYEMINALAQNKILLDTEVIKRYLRHCTNKTIEIPNNIADFQMVLQKDVNHKDIFPQNMEKELNRWFEKFYFNYFYQVSQICQKRFQVEHIQGNVIIYGAGNYGKALFTELKKCDKVHIVAWCDKNYKTCNTEIEIEAPQNILSHTYDTIIVAVRDNAVYEEIKGELCGLGVEDSKIQKLHVLE